MVPQLDVVGFVDVAAAGQLDHPKSKFPFGATRMTLAAAVHVAALPTLTPQLAPVVVLLIAQSASAPLLTVMTVWQ